MNCFVHDSLPAVGICVSCQKALCRQCVGFEAPRLVCRQCVDRKTVLGFEYRSEAAIGEWPFVHVCLGVNPATMRPKVAKGVVAIGNVAVGGIALGGVSCGLIALGGLSIGLLAALGGAALGVGLSIGGVTVGSIAVGGVAIGFAHAIGGVALGPATIDGQACNPSTRELVVRWLGAVRLPPSCR